jgi:hypothetical protein
MPVFLATVSPRFGRDAEAAGITGVIAFSGIISLRHPLSNSNQRYLDMLRQAFMHLDALIPLSDVLTQAQMLRLLR